MALAFKSVFVTVAGNAGFAGEKDNNVADFGSPRKVRVKAADCAIKSFHIGFQEGDHNFFFQRIAVHNVRTEHGQVLFDVFAMIRDDSDDLNNYTAEVEVLVIADVENV